MDHNIHFSAKKPRNRLVLLSTCFIVLIYLIYFCINIYADIQNIFKSSGYLELSHGEVDNLSTTHIHPTSNISSIADLNEGDILIRRQMNRQTYLPNKIFPTHFTHMAYYAGNGQIIEAVGNRDNVADEITMSPIEDTDWAGESFEKSETVFVLRPRAIIATSTLHEVSVTLAQIANDDSYHFGIRKAKNTEQEFDYIHKLLCTSFITDTLFHFNLIKEMPHIITPDYAFMGLINDPKFQLLKVKTL